MVVLMKLKEWVNQYFWLSEEDKELFGEYIGRVCYKNGQVVLCTEKELLNMSKTTYNLGTLLFNDNANAYYWNGKIVAESEDLLNLNDGVLWLME